MIPKKIHYCWFGGNPKTALIEKCISSWKKNLPDYEIIEWNEENFDINSTIYTKQAYEAKKWAFVSDYARLYALYTEGGIYFDTDVEVLKPLDAFLNNEFFTGFESKDSPVTAVMGAPKENEVVKMLLDEYNDRTFYKQDGSLDLMTNTVAITNDFLKRGIRPNGKLQKHNGVTVYPQIYFCPNNFTRIWEKPSPKSFTIHHFEDTWNIGGGPKGTFKFNLRRYLVGRARDTIGSERLLSLKKRK